MTLWQVPLRVRVASHFLDHTLASLHSFSSPIRAGYKSLYVVLHSAYLLLMYPSKPLSLFLHTSAVPTKSSPLANMPFTNNSGDEKVYDMQDSSESKLLQREDNHEVPLPTPVSTNAPKPKSKLSAAVIIPIWIVLSSTVIIYNNYLYNTLNFKFPVFLVTFHLSFAVSYARPG